MLYKKILFISLSFLPFIEASEFTPPCPTASQHPWTPLEEALDQNDFEKALTLIKECNIDLKGLKKAHFFIGKTTKKRGNENYTLLHYITKIPLTPMSKQQKDAFSSIINTVMEANNNPKQPHQILDYLTIQDGNKKTALEYAKKNNIRLAEHIKRQLEKPVYPLFTSVDSYLPEEVKMNRLLNNFSLFIEQIHNEQKQEPFHKGTVKIYKNFLKDLQEKTVPVVAINVLDEIDAYLKGKETDRLTTLYQLLGLFIDPFNDDISEKRKDDLKKYVLEPLDELLDTHK